MEPGREGGRRVDVYQVVGAVRSAIFLACTVAAGEKFTAAALVLILSRWVCRVLPETVFQRSCVAARLLALPPPRTLCLADCFRVEAATEGNAPVVYMCVVDELLERCYMSTFYFFFRLHLPAHWGTIREIFAATVWPTLPTNEAIRNLEEEFWVVGVVEQYAGFLEVLRRLLDRPGHAGTEGALGRINTLGSTSTRES